MKKFIAASVLVLSVLGVKAQITTDTTATLPINPTPATSSEQWNKIDLSNRSNDHLLIQYGADGWIENVDSVNPQGFSRHFNIYFMLDKPFKTNPRFSVGLGAGLSSSNIFFDRTQVDITSSASTLPFTNLDSANHFKKFKLTTVFLEAPVELRYTSNPLNSGSSLKAAIGLKVGTLLSAHTKGKTFEDKNGNTLNDYIQKEKTKRFFNTTRLAASARIGYGLLSLHGSYQLTTLLKTGAGPEIRPYSIGITISGL